MDTAHRRSFLCLLLILLSLTLTASQSAKEDQYGGNKEEKRPWWKKITDPLEKPFRTIQSVHLLLLGHKDNQARANMNINEGRSLAEKLMPLESTNPTRAPTTVSTPKPTTPSTAPPTTPMTTRKTTPMTTQKTTPMTTQKTTPMTTQKTTPMTTQKSTPSSMLKTTQSSTSAEHTLPGDEGSLKVRMNLRRFMEGPCGVSLESRIINGEETMPGEFPWLALIQVRDVYFNRLKFICGGTLINERYVLTAAHCVNDFRYEPVSVRLGEYNTEGNGNCSKMDEALMTQKEFEVCFAEPPKDYPVEAKIVHPNYNSRGALPNDIAMIRLKTVVDFTYYIAPVCLPIGDLSLNIDDIEIGINTTVAGWGMTEKLSNSPVPLKATLPLMEFDACKRLVKDMVPGKLCVGDNQGSSTCFGDSGGPIILRTMMMPYEGEETNEVEESIYTVYTRSVLLGIVSAGPGTCGVIQPTLTTNVLDYILWIFQNIDP